MFLNRLPKDVRKIIARELHRDQIKLCEREINDVLYWDESKLQYVLNEKRNYQAFNFRNMKRHFSWITSQRIFRLNLATKSITSMDCEVPLRYVYSSGLSSLKGFKD